MDVQWRKLTDAVHVYRTTTTDLAGNGPVQGLNSAIVGSTRKDTITGTDGNDLIVGGGGGDILFSKGGSDVFRYVMPSESKPGSNNFDTIGDFAHGQDHLDFSGLAGLSNFLFMTSAPKTLAPHTVLVVALRADSFVYANVSGSSQTLTRADMEIHVSGVHLTRDDFFL